MTNQEILSKAIQKSISHGFRYQKEFIKHGYQIAESFQVSEDGTLVAWSYHDERMPCEVYAVIFNHDFAKALWGTETDTSLGLSGMDPTTPWEYHLQQMVIAPDPIKYLGENL